MHLRRGNNLLVNVLLIALIIAGAGLVYYVIQTSAVTPATITPHLSEIGAGQATPITVSWSALNEGVPYTVYLYQGPTSSTCGTSYTLVGAKTQLTTPGYTFYVNPTTTSYYCGTVAGAKGSSAVSAIVTVAVNPTLIAPTLSLSSSGIDTGQTVVFTASVAWSGGVPPYSLTLYKGVNSTCSLDTTKATLQSGLNPQVGLTGTSTTFSVSDPATSSYYCASVTDSATVPHMLTSPATFFAVNPVLSASISPASPSVDMRQSINLTAIPAYGTPPYFYQWFTGTGCSSEEAIPGATASLFNTGPTGTSFNYSLLVSDSSKGLPAQRACANDVGVVNGQFTNITVSLSPATVTTDEGTPVKLTVAWTPSGTLPYTVILTTSNSTECNNTVPYEPPRLGVGRAVTTFSVTPSFTTYFCATVVDSATVPLNSNSTVAATVSVNPALSPSLTFSPPGIDVGQSASVTVTLTFSGGTSPYSATLYSGSSSSCASDTTTVAVSSGSNPQSGVVGSSTAFKFNAPASSTSYCATVTDGVGVTVSTPVTAFTVYPLPTATVTPSSPTIDSGQSVVFTANAVGGLTPYTYQWYTGLKCVSGNAISGRTSATYSAVTLTSSMNFSVLVGDSSKGTPAYTVCANAAVKVNPAQSPPLLVLSPASIDSGQTPTVTAKITWPGGSPPYTVTLYSGASSTCSSDTTVVSVSPAPNPQTGVTAKSTTFSFSAPTASLYYCATVKDSSATPVSVTSLAARFVVNTALGAPSLTISPKAMDAGQTVTVNATITWSGGTSPYTVTLYSGSSATCSSDSATVGVLSGSNPQTGLTGTLTSFTFAAPGSTTYYCAKLTDSAGVPVTLFTSTVSFTVNPSPGSLLLTISPTVLDSGQSTTVTAKVTWSGGTSPYTVTLYSGSSATCSSDTTVVEVLSGSNPQTGLTVTTTSFTLASPASSTYYCATVKESSAIPVTISSAASQFTVNPALTAAVISAAPSTLDTGQSATLSTTTPFSGGTPFYTCQWLEEAPGASIYSNLGSSFSCSPSSLPTLSTPYLFTVGVWHFELQVVDSSSTPRTVASAPVAVTINSGPTVALVISPTVLDSGQSTTVTAVVTWSGGTPPYTIGLYSGSSATCSSDTLVVTTLSGSNPQTGLTGTLTSFTFAAPGSTTYYCAKLTDSSGTPVTASSSAAAFTINPDLSVSTLVLSPLAIDSGQSTTVTAKVTWSGGTSPYTVTLYSGSSATCSSDTTVVEVLSGSNPQTGLTVTTATFTLASPASSTYYCATVKESSAIPVTISSAASQFTVNPALTATVSPSAPSIGSGQSIILTALPSQGTPPYSYQWYTGSACSVEISGATSSSYVALPVSTTQYSVKVTDSSTPTPATFCSNAAVTVNTPFTGTEVTIAPASSPAVLDSGQSVALTVSWTGAGTPPYTVQLTTSLSAGCSSPVALESQSGIEGTSATFTISPTSTTYYCATVTDSANSPESSSTTAAAVVSVNPALSTPTIGLSPSAIDTAQTASITATVNWSGGTSSYAVTLYSGSSASCASDTTLVAVSGSNPKSGLTGTSTTFSFASPASGTYYCAAVTDSATAPVSKTSSSSVFTVNAALTATISPASPTIDTGQSVVLTAMPSGGTPTYSYQWYSGSTCTSTIIGQTSQSMSTGALPSTASFSVQVRDSSPGIPAAIHCASVTVTVNAAITATISPASPTIDSGQFILLTAHPLQGTQPYFYQWYSRSGCASGYALPGETSSSFTTPTLTSSTNFSVLVTDSSIGTPADSFCASVTVTVSDPALTAPVISALPNATSVSGSSTLDTTTSFSGGTPNYTCQWLVEAPNATSFSDLGSSFSCTTSSLPTVSTGPLTAGTWEFELEVTDSSTVPNSVTSNAVTVVVS